MPTNVAFQSLSGFFRPCNFVPPMFNAGVAYGVSIPVGFFQALQHWLEQMESREQGVSIPVGFFQALQLTFA